MGGLDGPLLGIEVVGSGAEVFHQAEGMALIAHLNDSERRVGRQLERLTLQVTDGLLVGEVDGGWRVKGGGWREVRLAVEVSKTSCFSTQTLFWISGLQDSQHC